MHTLREVPVNRVDLIKGTEIETKEWVVSEEQYHIWVNEIEVGSVSASPSKIKELAVGYLVGGGMVSLDDITSIGVSCDAITVETENPEKTLDHIRTKKFQVSHIGADKIIHGSTVPASVILNSVSRLQSDTETWKKTHAVHSAALFTADGTLCELVEDISRHTAFDKVIGWGLLNNCHFSSTFVAISGRIARDMVVKAGNVGVPLVASRSTIIEPAASVASATGITLIGYVRDGHLVVFSHPERVVLD
ncbi:MAG: formate dehydrogenase accessory sulfurtransferase FdhD [Theionarchaea archaeon]|nr:MAG: hypothetical protein AYK18_01275 [Theionarchaea archaeon DG-70]MBU7011024.1 formate dehydrogenase accessory sulfurtransferase FdhD [Theionarchaea archaeon]